MLGQRLLQLRASAGLTETELAQRVGVSVQTLQEWEVDEGEPGPATLVKLAEALGVSEDELDANLAGAHAGHKA